ncbi:MAG: undecaprenyldiphospho-muramoylpentapeptide beta-N-acetylglucosaminyltransferase [Muribaculaceae bacterium]
MKVIISGGGTGGHIFPAISIANALRDAEKYTPDIIFVGAEGRMEMERVPEAGYPIFGLPVMGFDRKHIFKNIKVLWNLYKSMKQARAIINDFHPDIVIGVGGYASGPTLKEAQKMGIPTLIQEQNSYAGVTNKMLAPKADAICVAYDGMERFFPAEKIVMTGNPVRSSILSSTLTKEEAKKELGFDPSRPLVVSVGGSLGARTINDALKESYGKIVDSGASLLWQTGKLYAKECMDAVGRVDNMVVTQFVSRMELAYRAADLMISRAGASTISEVQLVGMPTILIPSPNVAEDHQRKNAEALVEKDAAVMILDADCREKLAETVVSLLRDEERRSQLAANVKKMALPDAAGKIVAKIYELLGQKQ